MHGEKVRTEHLTQASWLPALHSVLICFSTQLSFHSGSKASHTLALTEFHHLFSLCSTSKSAAASQQRGLAHLSISTHWENLTPFPLFLSQP